MFNHEQHPKKLIVFVLILTFLIGTASGIFGSWLTLEWKGRETIGGQETTIEEKITQLFSEEEKSVIEVVKKTNPAVVSIVISEQVSAQSPEPQFFEEFFGSPFRFEVPRNPPKSNRPGETALRRVGGGSGFIISPEGLIVTNKHVVSSVDAVYTVVLSDGKEFKATVVARDPVLDVALIKIEYKEAKNLPILNLGDSDKLQIGQTVIAIGYALAEFGNTVTKGVVSGVGRRVEAGNGFGEREVLDAAIQTDAAINPGNSGGPLLDLGGKVIGINTAVSQQGQLVGFAIPINTVKKTIESVQKSGRIVRPWLGVRYVPITPQLAEVNKLPVKYGVLIRAGQDTNELPVIPGSPADKAGLLENDIILEINGKKLEDKESLAKEVSQFNVGDEITLKVLSKGKEKQAKVTLGEFPVE